MKKFQKIKHIADFQSVAMMIGTIMGAGVLGIPYVVSRVGIWFGMLYLLGLGVIVTYVHVMVGEITLRTKQKLQMPGFARLYLGNAGGWLMTLIFLCVGYLSLYAYMVASGETLANIMPSISAFQWGLIFFICMSAVVWHGLEGIKKFDLFFAWILVILLIALSIFGIPYVVPQHFDFVMHADFIAPFGVIMFALGGVSIIPELENVLPMSGRKIERTLIIGTMIAVIVYLLFAIVTVGVTGLRTTEVATIGLGNVLGGKARVMGSVFAIIAMATSFAAIGLALRRMYEWERHWKRQWACVGALCIPLLLYVFGERNFISILGVAGALGGGIEGIMFVFMFWQARKKGTCDSRGLYVHFGKTIGSIIIAMFIIGIVITLFFS